MFRIFICIKCIYIFPVSCIIKTSTEASPQTTTAALDDKGSHPPCFYPVKRLFRPGLPLYLLTHLVVGQRESPAGNFNGYPLATHATNT